MRPRRGVRRIVNGGDVLGFGTLRTSASTLLSIRSQFVSSHCGPSLQAVASHCDCQCHKRITKRIPRTKYDFHPRNQMEMRGVSLQKMGVSLQGDDLLLRGRGVGEPGLECAPQSIILGLAKSLLSDSWEMPEIQRERYGGNLQSRIPLHQ